MSAHVLLHKHRNVLIIKVREELREVLTLQDLHTLDLLPDSLLLQRVKCGLRPINFESDPFLCFLVRGQLYNSVGTRAEHALNSELFQRGSHVLSILILANALSQQLVRVDFLKEATKKAAIIRSTSCAIYMI